MSDKQRTKHKDASNVCFLLDLPFDINDDNSDEIGIGRDTVVDDFNHAFIVHDSNVCNGVS